MVQLVDTVLNFPLDFVILEDVLYCLLVTQMKDEVKRTQLARRNNDYELGLLNVFALSEEQAGSLQNEGVWKVLVDKLEEAGVAEAWLVNGVQDLVPLA